MIAATAVLVSHAYPVALGTGSAEPFQLTLGMSLGGLAVYSFFIISGFFISQSFDRAPHLQQFAIARILRIYPALLVVLILTTLLIGPLFTKLSLPQYFSQPETLIYIPRNLALIKLQYELPGVFEHNPYPQAINGSLWTLVYEVGCYAMVACVALSGFTANVRRFAVFVVAYFCIYVAIGFGARHGSRLMVARDLTWPFVFGMTLYHLRKYLLPKPYLLLAVSIGAFLSYGRPWFREVFTLGWGYLVICGGFLTVNTLSYYNRLGDYSYGMYIYAYPVEQIVVSLHNGCTPMALMAWAFPSTLALAILSWHLVEKPANAQRTCAVQLLTRINLAFHRANPSAATEESTFRRNS
jgi:peptidoglycan/LPS O-acetylase OafA/YrhL